MVQKNIKLLQLIAFCIACSGIVQAKLTTLKHFDPSPNYSANNSMMPPNSHFLDLAQARIKHEQPAKKRVLGFNISGFVQRSVRARGYTGSTEYGSVIGNSPNAFEMGDFRGTMYPMGLFLGFNPKTGKNIWGSSDVTNPNDTGNPADITQTTIEEFLQDVDCLQEIAFDLAGINPTTSPNPVSAKTPVFVYPIPATGTTVPANGFSVFHAHALAQDNVYFGAFSVPITYQQAGLRMEINVNCTDYIGLTIQGGVSNIKQNYVNNITSTNSPGQTSVGPYSLSSLATTGTTTSPISPLYNQLNIASSTAPTGTTTAQGIFDSAISNNIDQILNPDCLGNDPRCGFDDYSIDDIKLILSLKKVYTPFNQRYEETDDVGSWPDMIFTPYTYVGGSFPCGKEIDYSNYLSLPFGNNGHTSVGGAIGMTFDFAESVEVGIEGGATYFFDKEEKRPFPTHRLQRVLYPFEARVLTQPGINWHFRALLNAYQFIKHCNFWFTYELIEHRKDSFIHCDKKKAQYFTDEPISCRSDWKAQFFNAGFSFDISPGIQASLVWQQPICPRNAYYPVSILGSVNFMF